MRAMVLEAPGKPLVEQELPEPEPADAQILIEVSTCGVCRTDLHIYDGELAEPKLPLVLGHQIVGRVIGAGKGAGRFAEGADERFCFPVPGDTPDDHTAPLLCAGLIGYRSLRLAGKGERLGLYGFGSSAHIVCQVAVAQGWRVYALTREGDTETQELARSLGAEWAGAVGDPEAADLDAAIVFAPVGDLMVEALKAMAPGGTVVSAGIHMSDIPSFPYELLWEERSLRSVANLTRRDGEEFLPLAASVPVETRIQVYPLEDANRALDDIRHGRVEGSAVLAIGG